MIHLRPNYESLQEAVQIQIKAFGGLRAMSRAVDISPGYLSRMARGDRVDPSEETLSKLGLERLVFYRDAK